MKIGIVTHNFPSFNSEGRAAAGNFVPPLCTELQRRGNFVCVLAPDVSRKKDDYPFVVERFGACCEEKLLGSFRLWNPLDLYRFFGLLHDGTKKLKRLTKEYQLDFFLALWAFPAGLICRRAAQSAPYFVWCLGSDIWALGRLPVVDRIISRILRDAGRVYADGMGLADETAKLSGRSCEFLPTTRSWGEIEPLHKNEKAGTFTFLFVGRWEAAKGPDLFLQAAEILLKKRFDVAFRMFGGGSQARRVLFHGLKLHGFYADRFTVGSYLSEREFRDELLSASCFVIPSRKESVPIALTDAVSAGRPVIVSDAGDMKYWVEKFRLGTVFKREDLPGLVGAMERMIESPQQMDPACRSSYLKTFNVESVASTLIRDAAGAASFSHVISCGRVPGEN
jgi:glycosyltransferase involved in cell wall biosynthesis